MAALWFVNQWLLLLAIIPLIFAHRSIAAVASARAAHHQSDRLARELETRNAELERAKEALEAGNAALEGRVAARTAELEAANNRLRAFSVQAADLAVEQERTRVAREIHDGLGHHLDAIKIHLGAARLYLANDPATARESLLIAGSETSAAQQEVRRAIDALLSDHAASPLEELLASDVRGCELAGIRVDVLVMGTPVALPEQIKHTLYRIGQEALNNVRRHATAEHARLAIDYRDPDRVTLTVADDGQGFDADAPPAGRGLNNLRERAALIGGALRLAAAPGQGVTIEVEAPLCAQFVS